MWLNRFVLSVATLLTSFVILGSAPHVSGTERSPVPVNVWTVSSSDQDPYENTAPPMAGVRTLYLWVDYTSPIQEWAEAAFRLEGTSGLIPIGIVAREGFFVTLANQSDNGFDLHIVGNLCEEDHVVVAEIIAIEAAGGGQMCLVPTVEQGVNCTRLCELLSDWYLNSYEGFASDSPYRCKTWTYAFVPCGPLPVEPRTWGRVKAQYK